MILGITGPIKHGKSTLAEMFLQLEPTAQHGESSLVIGEVANGMISNGQPPRDPENFTAISDWANTLPAALAAVVPSDFSVDKLTITPEQLADHPGRHEKLLAYIAMLATHTVSPTETVSPATKDQFRPLLQWIGGHVTERLERSIWYEELMRRAEKAATDGCKLYVIGGVRYHADDVVLHQAGGKVLEIYNPHGPVVDPGDPTELARQQVVKDSTVINNGTLADLRACAERILHGLTNDTLQAVYHADAAKA